MTAAILCIINQPLLHMYWANLGTGMLELIFHGIGSHTALDLLLHDCLFVLSHQLNKNLEIAQFQVSQQYILTV